MSLGSRWTNTPVRQNLRKGQLNRHNLRKGQLNRYTRWSDKTLREGQLETTHANAYRQNLRKGQLNRAIDTQGTASPMDKAQANWDKPLPHEALPRSGRAARWTKLLCLKMNGSNPHTRRRHIVKIPTANDARSQTILIFQKQFPSLLSRLIKRGTPTPASTHMMHHRHQFALDHHVALSANQSTLMPSANGPSGCSRARCGNSAVVSV